MKKILGIPLPHEHVFDGYRFHDTNEHPVVRGLSVRLQDGTEFGKGCAIYVLYEDNGTEETRVSVHGADIDDMQRRMLLRLAAHSPFLLALVDEAARAAGGGGAE